MKLSHIRESGIPTPDEVSKRMQDHFAQYRGKTAPPPQSNRHPEADEWQRQQDRAEQQQRDDRATANEDSSQVPECGNNIRTIKNKMEGKVERVGRDEVFFRLADGRLMKTPLNNVIVIEKLADEDDEIMESRIDEISTEVLAKYKTAAGKDASAADKKGDFKRGDKRFSGIVKATKKQFDNDKKKTTEGSMGGINRCAPSTDVSYDKVLNDVTDKWRGDTVKVKEAGPYTARLGAFLEAFDSNAFADILGNQHKEIKATPKAEVKRIPLSNPNFFLQFRPQTDNLRPLGWQVRGKNAPDDILQQGTSSNLKDATQEAEKWLATKSGATASSNHVTINFNAAFAKQFAQGGETLWCDIWEGPMLVFSTEPQEGFKKTVIRTPEHNRSQGAALLPVMGISPKEANKAGLDGNSRYKLGPQEDLGDGVHAYALEWDSKVEKGERKIFKEPILQTSTSLDEETITEISDTVKRDYIKGASRWISDTASGEGFKAGKKGTVHNTAEETPKEKKRQAGIDRAADKLGK